MKRYMQADILCICVFLCGPQRHACAPLHSHMLMHVSLHCCVLCLQAPDVFEVARIKLCRDLAGHLANILFVKQRMDEAAVQDAIIRVSSWAHGHTHGMLHML